MISLIDGRLVIAISVRNLSDTPMPAGFGLHPYFPSTPWTHVQARYPGMWETDAEVLPTPPRVAAGWSRSEPPATMFQSGLRHVFTGWTRRARIIGLSMDGS